MRWTILLSFACAHDAPPPPAASTPPPPPAREAAPPETLPLTGIEIAGEGGTGDPSAGLTGDGSLAVPQPTPPSVSVGLPQASGNLDKAIIRRYIKRNLHGIQACYEKALAAKPTLQGTVAAHFTIEPTGRVSNSTASGVDPAVSTCVAGVIATIEFPAPQGGGSVDVNYPFAFSP